MLPAVSVVRAEYMLGPYNTTLFPTVLSDDDVAAVLAGANFDNATWPVRNASAPSRRLDELSDAERVTHLRQVHVEQSAEQLAQLLGAVRAGNPNATLPARKWSDASEHIRRLIRPAGSTGASNAWVVRMALRCPVLRGRTR